MSSLARVRPLSAVMGSPMADRPEDALARIDEVEHVIRAMVPEVARRGRVEQALAQVDPSLPMAGVPVAVKDNIAVDGLPTRAGTTLPDSVFASAEASAVTALKAAGCVVLGKTETTELAFADPAPTVNPHDPRRTPGGSSSGSAAAVAAGYVPVALGSQTVDSTITPAAYCGVVGFKASFGRFSLDGVVPFAPSLDHLGILGADVASVSHVASLLDSGWTDAELSAPLRLGLVSGPLLDLVEPEARAAFAEQVDLIRRKDTEVIETVPVSDPERIRRDHYLLMAGEFAAEQKPLFERYRERYRPLVRGVIEKGIRATAEEMKRASESAGHLRGVLTTMADDLGLDAFACPSATGPAPVGLDFIGDPAMSVPWAAAGLPCVTVPAGQRPTPIGMQLIGRPGSDERLLAAASWLESWLAQPPGGR